MRSADQVAEFVAAALNTGHSRADIAAALGRAVWAEAEIQAGLDAWSAEDFRPPVPRPRTYLSAREAFIYGLLYASLVVTAWYAIDIGYALINAFWEEDTGQTYHGSIDGVRWWVAVLSVSFPIFLITDFLVRRSIRQDAAKARSQVRRWLGYVSLLLAALSLAAVAATTFNSFLEGALSAQVVAQALLTAVMAGLIFLYILAEMEA